MHGYAIGEVIMFDHPGGSVWTQWDLHIHTPATVLANAFVGATEDEKWDNYIKALAKSGLQVIAPTNYFCLDGIDRVVSAMNAGRLGDVTCVLPNVEFRIGESNKEDEHIHVHVIFADRFADDLQPIQDFLDSVELFMKTASDKTERCTRETVRRLGADKVLVAIRELQAKLQKSFDRLDDYVLVAGARGQGTFRPGKGKARGETVAIELDRLCDVIYGSTSADRDFFLQEDRYDGALKKPVFACSDAHDLVAIGSKYSWVKANPTYEGLKQTVFEPELRMSFDDPMLEKSLYSSIESIRFTNPDEAQSLLPTNPIPLNTDLTTIIGGKSTGKSLLLHYLARVIDEPQVLEREAVVYGEQADRYAFCERQGFDVEVKWKDGQSQAFSTRNVDTRARKIVYIPQRFLNGICELDMPSGGRSLDEFTREALEQRPALETAFEALHQSKSNADKNIRESLDRLFEHYESHATVVSDLADAGDVDGVSAEITRLNAEVSKLRDGSKMTDEEKSNYDKLSTELTAVAAFAESLNSDDKLVSAARDGVERAISRLEGVIDGLERSIQHPELRAATKKALKPFRSWSDKADSAFSDIEENSAKFSQQLANRRKQAEKAIKPLASSVANSRRLAELTKKKRDESTRLQKIKKLVAERKSLAVSISTEVGVLAAQTNTLIESYSSTCAALAKESDALGDINFTPQLSFDSDAFQTEFVTASVKTNSLKSHLGITGTYEFEFDSKKHLDYVRQVADGLVTGKIKLMKGVKLRSALEALTENRLLIDYRIEYQGDRIEIMSPGKRALVVLKILLELSNDEWPILLDQPEDDLDSRSVYRELVQYFKRKKRTRQVILITHNPNLVVGADADSIVVANQSGQELGRENPTSRFEYVSGGLESTFTNRSAVGILHQEGIREHVCDVLEGGKDAFKERERKYRLGQPWAARSTSPGQ